MKRDSSSIKGFYNPKTFFTHAASLRQAFAHCEIFSTAASRRSGNRISISLLGIMLSHPLPVIALVSHYLTNKLIGRRPILERLSTLLIFENKFNYQIMENYPIFRSAMLHFKVSIYALLTRSPLANASHWHADLRR